MTTSWGNLRRWERPLAWTLGLLPVGFLLAVVWLHQPPAALTRLTLELRGEWRVVSNTARVGSCPSDPRTFRLPGGYAAQGGTGATPRLCRNVEIDARLSDRKLGIAIGDVRSAVVTFFVDGERIGATNPLRAGKSELLGLELVDVPPLSRGIHTFTLAFDIASPGMDGVVDNRFWLADYEQLRSHVDRISSLRTVIYAAGVSILGAFALIFVLISVFVPLGQRRGRYRATAAIITVSALYIAVNAGWLGVYQGNSPRLWLYDFMFVAAFCLVHPEFIAGFVGDSNTLFLKLNRVVSSALILLLVVVSALLGFNAAVPVATAASSYTFIPIAYVFLRPLIALVRGWSPELPLLAACSLCFVATGAFDTARDVYLVQGPRWFMLGVIVTAAAAAAVLVLDMVRTARAREELMQSLQAANTTLVSSLEAERELLRLKDEFVSNVTHELRTPLNSIVNLPKALLGSFQEVEGLECRACGQVSSAPGASERAHCPQCGSAGTFVRKPFWIPESNSTPVVMGLKQVERTGERLLSLINNILSVTLFNPKTSSLTLTPVDTNKTLTNVCVSHPQSSRISCTPIPDAPAVLAQERALRQLLLSLIDNALKFSEASSPVDVWGEVASGEVHFHVRDRGIGIDASQHKLIFEPFRQVDGSLTRPFGGAGLGLAVAKRIVEMHGGRIWLESALGKGSTFHFSLQLAGPNAP
ncbi:MAG: sensor histidine kinase [Myxococcaceae bacterium]